ncbi:hypothetical protein B0G69_7636 [Paraburkholderia sp. RAU2J]|nr:hypothetical protein B0G69_7636 [Paraburkholderia sp. RAU2J]
MLQPTILAVDETLARLAFQCVFIACMLVIVS